MLLSKLPAQRLKVRLCGPKHPSQLRWEGLLNARLAASVPSAGLWGRGLAPHAQTPTASMEMTYPIAASARQRPESSSLAPLSP